MYSDSTKAFVPETQPPLQKIVIGPTLRQILSWCAENKQPHVIRVYQDDDLVRLKGLRDFIDRAVILGYPMDYHSPELRKFVIDYFDFVGSAIL